MRTTHLFLCGIAVAAVSGCSRTPDVVIDRRPSDSGMAPAAMPDRTPCQFNADCPAPQVCEEVLGVGRVCVVQCREDRDCCTDGQPGCGLACRAAACVSAGVETCNGLDDNGNGTPDDGFDLVSDPRNCGRCGLVCDSVLAHVRAGGTTCTGGTCALAADGCAEGFANLNGAASDGCEYGCHPTNGGVEISDGDDNDCDGAVDEGFACTFGELDRSCGSGVGICGPGVQRCQRDGTWSACEGATEAASAEQCNGLDDDCDREVDEGFNLMTDLANCGRCGNDCHRRLANAEVQCADGHCDFIRCNADARNFDDDLTNGCERCPVIPVHGADICGNTLDDDCNGTRDDGCACVAGTARRCGPVAPACDETTGTCRGVCRLGMQDCIDGNDGARTVWGSCVGAVFPASAESCNGLDDDCDGVIPANEQDADRDGYRICDGDCDDTNRFVNPDPSTFEVCDGIDEDCDGFVDEDFFVDFPCRGLGVCGRIWGQFECATFFTPQCSTDIDGSQYPPQGVPPIERCDREDNDCDGFSDNAPPWIVANDTQNCGACGNVCFFSNATPACTSGRCVRGSCLPGYVDVDRIDANGCEYQCTPTVNTTDGPNVQCDGRDNDCDGSVDENCACREGTVLVCGPMPPTCDPLSGVCRGECHLGSQICVSGILRNCTGAVFPASVELCNGLDDDCTGGIPNAERDLDGDGFMACEGDCNDANPAIRPGVTELCDGVDNNCDGRIDEGFFIGAPCEGEGACGTGRRECASTTSAQCSTDIGGSQYPTPAPTEICGNLVDDDCDGSTDEGCACTPGTTVACGLDPLLNGVGICRVGTQTCAGGVLGPCLGAQGRLPEACNGLDDDCDTQIDDGFDLATNPRNCGACGNNCLAQPNVQSASCVSGACANFVCRPGFQTLPGQPTCSYGCFPTNGGVEQCDRIDNDCNGRVDEIAACNPPPPMSGSMTFVATFTSTAAFDQTAQFCATYRTRAWSCTDYAFTVGGRTLSVGGVAVTGDHLENPCLRFCNGPEAGKVYLYVRRGDGSLGLSTTATVAVTFNGLAVPGQFVPNNFGGANVARRFSP